MTFPAVEVRVDWRKVGFSQVTNDGFETASLPWTVAAGINAAGNVVASTDADAYAGSRCGEITTTATAGSGCHFDFGTTSFVSGRTYRFGLWMKAVSGTDSARITIGSLGTPADRAITLPTLTGSWVYHYADWTPSSTRTDAECVVATNVASIMVARFDHVEVYELLDDISAYVTDLTWTRGTSTVSGGAGIGTAVVTVRNDDLRFNPGNTGGAYGSNVMLGREVLIRSTWSGAPYAHFHGDLERIVLLPETRMAELHLVDAFDRINRAEASVAASVSRSVHTFRGLVLDDVAELSARRSLDTSDPENMNPLTEADQASALTVLEMLNEATGTAHHIRPSVSSSVCSQYVTRSRTDLATGAVVQAFSADDVGVSVTQYDMADIVNVMKVTPVQRGLTGTATVWETERVPFTVGAGLSRTLWASFDAPVFSQAVAYTATNSPTVTLTAFSRSAKIVITAGGSAATVSALSVEGNPYSASEQETAEVRDTGSVTTYMVRTPGPARYGKRGPASAKGHAGTWIVRTRREPSTIGYYEAREGEIASDYIPSTAHAEGLASWWVYRYKNPPIRPSITVFADDVTTQLARKLLDRISLTSTRLSLSAVPLLIVGISTHVGPAGDWTTTYTTETAPTVATWFTLGGTADEGVGGTGVLAY